MQLNVKLKCSLLFSTNGGSYHSALCLAFYWSRSNQTSAAPVKLRRASVLRRQPKSGLNETRFLHVRIALGVNIFLRTMRYHLTYEALFWIFSMYSILLIFILFLHNLSFVLMFLRMCLIFSMILSKPGDWYSIKKVTIVQLLEPVWTKSAFNPLLKFDLWPWLWPLC